MTDRIAHAQDLLRRVQADVLVSGDPGTVTWLTGHETPIATGPSPFGLGAHVVLERSGPPTLVLSDDEALVEPTAQASTIVRFPGFRLDSFDRLEPARRAMSELISGRRLAVEATSVVVGLLDADVAYVDVTQALLECRAIKDSDELARLRRAIELCDVGQAALRESMRDGCSELDLWSAITGAIDRAAGEPTPVLADLVSGARTGEIGGAPEERLVREGDLVLCDLVPRYQGYWGDSCATVGLGAPSDWSRAAHRAVLDALDAATESIRPGVRAGEIDSLVRERLTSPLPHHVGHGLGCSSHELPRLVPGASTILRSGMVLALEPGIYQNEGIRLERVVVVVDDGFEVLSGHDVSL